MAMTQVLDFAPDVVVSMTTRSELGSLGCDKLVDTLRDHGIEWLHLPLTDYGAPTDTAAPEWARAWAATSAHLRSVLATDGRVLIHCRGGCGRSGMVALRLMVDGGEAPDHALQRLRNCRPCAVETDAQIQWATVVCDRA